MRLAAALPADPEARSNIETIELSPAHLELIGRISRRINPDMPLAFGHAHVVRILLDRFEEAEIDLSAAGSENEVSAAAVAALRGPSR
jgi:hypothetical protein